MIKRFLLGVLAVACVSCAETTAVKLLNADDFKSIYLYAKVFFNESRIGQNPNKVLYPNWIAKFLNHC